MTAADLSCPSPGADGKTLVFVHIPKAGGTTLHAILERQYAPAVTWRCDMQQHGDLQRFLALPPRQRDAVRCLRGHLPFSLCALLPRPAACVTLLREPVQRFVSQYSHCRRNPANAEAIGFPRERTRTLEDYIELEIERHGINLQTRLIGGYLDLQRPEPPFDPLPADALDTAKHNLQTHFLAAAPVERFDEFLVLMKRLLGWRCRAYTRRNIDPAASAARPLPPALAERIRELHHLDRELFRFVRVRFEQQVREQGAGFQREVERLRRRAALLHGLQTLYNRPSLLRLRRRARRACRSLAPPQDATNQDRTPR